MWLGHATENKAMNRATFECTANELGMRDWTGTHHGAFMEKHPAPKR